MSWLRFAIVLVGALAVLALLTVAADLGLSVLYRQIARSARPDEQPDPTDTDWP